MVNVVIMSDLVEANGKTVKENNLAIAHELAIGTLVEVNCHYQPEHKTRQFIAAHGRDCDGTPLYSLTPKRDMCEDQIFWLSPGKQRDTESVIMYRRLYHNGSWGKESLIVIESIVSQEN